MVLIKDVEKDIYAKVPETWKRRGEVLKYKLKNPWATSKEIAKACWMDPEWVRFILSQVPKIQKMANEEKKKIIADMYNDIMEDITDITSKTIKRYKNKIEDDEEVMLETRELKDLSAIAKETLERQRLADGQSTSNGNITINFS